jgi:uncharacterized protein (DUF1501 family)
MKRRDFLLHTARFAAATAAIPYARLAYGLGPFTDYKALVCLYMYGGNDSHNTIIPLGSEYAAYARARAGLAMANRTDAAADNPDNAIFTRPLNSISPTNVSGRSFALHTSLKRTAALFNAGKVAVVSNVGTMIQPTSKAQFQSESVPLPPQLFSHSDQENYWQSLSGSLTQSGWGGRMADLIEASGVNGNTPFAAAASIAGDTAILRGETSVPFSMSPYGPQAIQAFRFWNAYSGCTNCPDTQRVFENRIIAARTNRFEEAYGDAVARAMDTQRFLSNGLDVTPTFRGDFPGTGADVLPLADPAKPGLAQHDGTLQNPLADQLRMVARLIAARNRFVSPNGVTPKRQVFFVAIGGFDNHGAEYATHAQLLAAIDGAVASFQAKMENLGMSQNVTLFTASEFGRTLESNGEGSDHGWGGHHLVVGGAVQGGKFYGGVGAGNFPVVALNTATDVGEGRLLPTIAVEEYAATLGRWFGLSTTELRTLLPNLNNFQQFTNHNVGFLG